MARTNRTRLSVESLEDRAVPATHTWTGPSGGNWNDAANWNGGIPTSGESGGTFVEINTNVNTTMDVAGLTLDGLTITNSNSSTHTLNTPLTLVSGAATLTQGAGSTTITGSSITLTPGQATFSVNGPFATLTINSVISGGATTLVKDGEFPLILGGNNTLAASSFKLGTVVVTHSNALGAGSVQFDGGGRLNTAGGADITVANPIRVQQLPLFSEVAIGSQAGGTGKTSFTGNVLIDVDGASLLLEASSSKGTFFFGNIAVASGKKADVVVGSGATDQQVVLSNSTGTPNDFGGGKVTVGGGAQLRVFGGADLNLPDNSNVHFSDAASTLELDAADETIGVLVSDAPGAGIVKGSTGNRTLTLGGNNNTGVFTGQLIDGTAGTLSLTVFTTNAAPDPLTSQTLGGTSTFTGPTNVNGGDLIVNGNNGQSAVAVSFDGLLGGSGSVGTVTAGAFGFVRPGGKTTPGTLSTQNVELQDLSAFEVRVNGPAAGQFSALNVTGTVNIADDAEMFIPGTAGTLGGQSIVVINNDGNDAIVGTFKGIAQNGMVTADDGRKYTVNYLGGDGNDLTLTGLPVGKFQFSAAASTVNEGADEVTVTVTRTNGTDGPVTLLLGASGTALDGSDFALPLNASVTFADGETSRTVTVGIIDDARDENDETFALTLFSPDGGGTLGTQVTHTVTITDNDAPPTVSVGNVTAAEGNIGSTAFTFVVTLSAASEKPITVFVQTADGIATAADGDYSPGNVNLTFNPGQISIGVTVQVHGDAPFETNETFTVVLSAPTNATIGTGTGTGVITNDDKASSTTTLTVDPNPAVPGQAVTFTATVAAVAPATGTPTGLVVFRLGDVELGTGELVNGVVTFTTATLLPGTYEIDAAFVGNDNTVGSDSNFVDVIVNRASSAITLAASLNPSVAGQSVTFTARVSAVGTGVPTGLVVFRLGDVELGTGELNGSGVATFTTAALRAGSYDIDAAFVGDDNFSGSDSNFVAVTVNLGTAAVALNLPATAKAGATVTFTPTVTAVAPATVPPVGRLMITFIDGGVIRGIEIPTGGTFTLPALGIGTHTVTVQFAPADTSDFAAAAADATITITAVASAAPLPSGLLVTGPTDGKGLQFAPTNGRYTTGQQRTDLLPSGVEVRVAQGDVNGDGVMDLIVGSGPGGGPLVRVFDGTNPTNLLASFVPLDPTHRGGLFVAAGDLNGDGKAEIVVTPDAPDAFSGTRANGLHVQVFDGAKLTGGGGQNPLLADFDGLASLSGESGQNNPLVKLGGRAAVADVNGDGKPDLLVAAGTGGGPRITIWNGTGFAGANGGRPTANPIANLFVFETTQRGGAFLTSGDIDGDGKAEVVVGGGPGGGPRLRIVDGAKLLVLPNLEGVDLDQPENLSSGLVRNNFFAGDQGNRGGVRLTAVDVDADGRADVVAGSGAGERSLVRVFTATALLANTGRDGVLPDLNNELDPFGAVVATGVWVG